MITEDGYEVDWVGNEVYFPVECAQTVYLTKEDLFKMIKLLEGFKDENKI